MALLECFAAFAYHIYDKKKREEEDDENGEGGDYKYGPLVGKEIKEVDDDSVFKMLKEEEGRKQKKRR